MKMIDQGKSLREMRAQIDKTYSKYGPPTPTPPVPWYALSYHPGFRSDDFSACILPRVWRVPGYSWCAPLRRSDPLPRTMTKILLLATVWRVLRSRCLMTMTILSD